MNKTIEVPMSQKEKAEALGQVIDGFVITRLKNRPIVIITGDRDNAHLSGLSEFIDLMRFRLGKDGKRFSGDRYESEDVCGGHYDVRFQPYKSNAPEMLAGYHATSMLFIVIEVAGAEFNKANRDCLRVMLGSCTEPDNHVIQITGDNCDYFGIGSSGLRTELYGVSLMSLKSIYYRDCHG